MSTYQPPKGLKPGDTVRVVGYSTNSLATVKTVGRKWLTLKGIDRRRIDMQAGQYEPTYTQSTGDDARVYRPEDPAGWADVHRIKVSHLRYAARKVALGMDGAGVKGAVEEATDVIEAYTALLAAVRATPTNPDEAERRKAQGKGLIIPEPGNGKSILRTATTASTPTNTDGEA